MRDSVIAAAEWVCVTVAPDTLPLDSYIYLRDIYSFKRLLHSEGKYLRYNYFPLCWLGKVGTY
jgi:hypothetical protein